MRKQSVAVAVAVLTGAGIALAYPASAQKTSSPPNFEGWDEGGAVGCFSPSLKGRERAVAERLGGKPCEDDAPKPQSAPASRQWLVGLWVLAQSSCRDGQFPVRLRKDGSYDRLIDAGTWTYAKGIITFSYRDTRSAGGEFITGDMERSLPVKSDSNRVTRLSDDRMTIGPVSLRRCSTNPDAVL